MPNSTSNEIFKPDLSSLGGVFKSPKLSPWQDVGWWWRVIDSLHTAVARVYDYIDK